jgi:hypothetical protein
MKQNLLKFLIFLLIFIVLPIQILAEPTANEYQSLELKNIITGGADIISLNKNYILTSFTSELSLFPKDDYHQKILVSEFYPKDQIYEQEENKIIFKWFEQEAGERKFKYVSNLKTSSNRLRVNKKINFPLISLSSDYFQYLSFTQTTDTNEKIKKLANELAQGETDLFELEYKISNYLINYLNYSLTIYTKDENKPSTWVIDNKVGACDEYTNLFISINRELGIPARFVSGIAYSNSELFDEPWGNHAWAEIYFPEIGWIPYDLTYVQLGYIDATHIILNKAKDGTTPSILFQGKGLNFNFNPYNLSFDTEIISMINKEFDYEKLSVGLLKEKVGFNSHNLVILNISNPNDHYIISNVNLAQTQGLKIIDPLNKIVLLKPREMKTVYWVIKIDQELEKGYHYSFPISVFTSTQTEYKTSFEAYENELDYSEEYVNSFVKEAESKKLNSFNLDCDNNEFIQEENIFSICKIKLNEGFQEIENATFCFNNVCQKNNIENLKQISLKINGSNLGVQTKILNVSYIMNNKEYNEEHYVTYIIKDVSNLNFGNLSYFKTIEFGENKTISFFVEKSSFVGAKEVYIRIVHENYEEYWYFPIFEDTKFFELDIDSIMLMPNSNNFTLYLDYVDNKNITNHKNITFAGDFVNTTIIQKIILYSNGVVSKIAKKANRYSIDHYGEELTVNQRRMIVIIVLFVSMVTLFILFKSLIEFSLRLIKGEKKETVKTILESKKK